MENSWFHIYYYEIFIINLECVPKFMRLVYLVPLCLKDLLIYDGN